MLSLRLIERTWLGRIPTQDLNLIGRPNLPTTDRLNVDFTNVNIVNFYLFFGAHKTVLNHDEFEIKTSRIMKTFDRCETDVSVVVDNKTWIKYNGLSDNIQVIKTKT